MIPNLQLALNQQFQQGCYFAQQAMLAEQMGNLSVASQCYDQAIAMIGTSMNTAGQSGIPIHDNVFFSFSFCHFNAARVKAAAGWPQAAPSHLGQALQAVNQAIVINPNFFQYHSAAGAVLLAQGNVADATRAFQHAIQLNPMDGWSQWMLASLYSAQGNTVASSQYYAAATQVQPNLPSPQQFMEQYQTPPAPAGAGPQKQSQHDWFEIINNALKFGNNVAGLFQQGGDQSQAQWGAQPGWDWSGLY
jgi:tetratricopeptide (TPR) repeat protein